MISKLCTYIACVRLWFNPQQHTLIYAQCTHEPTKQTVGKSKNSTVISELRSYSSHLSFGFRHQQTERDSRVMGSQTWRHHSYCFPPYPVFLLCSFCSFLLYLSSFINITPWALVSKNKNLDWIQEEVLEMRQTVPV